MESVIKRQSPVAGVALVRELLKIPLKLRMRLCLSRAERLKLRGFRMAAFPETPITAYAIGKIADTVGIKLQGFSPWSQYDVVLAFQDSTHAIVDVDSYLKGAYGYTGRPPPMRILNAKCQDISKRWLGRHFEEVFGYPMEVNPTCYYGAVVRKSDGNASHDGVVIQCPITGADVEPGSSYTVLVNNEREGNVVEDMRVVWIGSLMEFFYLKHRPLADRFGNTNTFVTMEKTGAHISAEEQRLIGDFANAMGLDYGEMDCLRDKDTGRLYICDLNKTPAGPPNGLVGRDASEAVRLMAHQFVREFVCSSER